MRESQKAAEAFNAYVVLLAAAADADTLFEVIVQADNDGRLSRAQQEALDAVANARRLLFKWGAP